MRTGLVRLLVVVACCTVSAAQEPEPHGHRAHFESDPTPATLGVTGNPLDYAAARIGIDARDFPLPRAEEGSYRLACRFPVIDAVMNQPLYMKVWAEESADAINGAHAEAGLRAVSEVAALLRGIPVAKSSPSIVPPDWLGSADEARAKLATLPFSSALQEALAELLDAHLAASALAHQALAGLSEEDREFFRKNPGYFLAPDGKQMPSITGNVDSHFDFIARARRVRLDLLFQAALQMSAAVQAYCDGVAALSQGELFTSPEGWRDSLHLDTPAGLMIIAGTGDDLHQQDAALLVDLGGDDRHAHAAGGCDGQRQVAVCIDHTGNDVYAAADRSYVQGFGFLGVGLLVDLAGNDTYEARHFAQGAGILGVGALLDRRGDDRFIAHTFCQGAGMFGAGVLLESAGEDFYDSASLGQGGATTLGLGVLSDLGGDDRYHLKIGPGKDTLGGMAGYGQGGALSWRHYPWRGRLTAYGGAGMLLDAAGNDRYRSGAWCSQGGSYIMSLGALVDDAGNDHYTAGTGQGSGIHVTSAILVDRDGHDVYDGGFRSGGSGGDRSPCLFIDYHGDDIYRSRTSAYGTGVKPLCYSLFIDYEGDDTYVCPQPRGRILFNNWDSFGGVWPESAPHLWPYAMCLDLGGGDEYQVRNRANDSERHSFGHGIHLDMEWNGGDVIGDVPSPLPPYSEARLPEELTALGDPDLWVRFRAVGAIVDQGAAALPAVVAALCASEHRQQSRDLLECLHHLLAAKVVTDAHSSELATLLGARDEEVRKTFADSCGIWRLAGVEEALLETLTSDASAAVRRYAASSLLTLESTRALPLFREAARNDPSDQVRRVAVIALGRIDDDGDDGDDLPLLLDLLENDPSPFVRVYAAEGLADLEDERALPALRRAAQSFDAYLMRAAGKGLARLYQVEGLEALIRSLDFPSIDAFYNYDYNVPNFIEAYSGHTLPEQQRYQQSAWVEWFREHRDELDMRASVDAYRALTEMERQLQGLSERDQVEPLETFLREHPRAVQAQKRLARLLNQLAWGMVTAAEGTPERDAETGLRYAQRCVELDPQPGYVDTLAEAQFASGDIEGAARTCREMLEEHPGERMFLDRLERCYRILGAGN